MVRQSTLGQDFRRLWGAYAVSAAGSAVGMRALPLIALLVLDSSALQVSMLAALALPINQVEKGSPSGNGRDASRFRFRTLP